MISNQNLVIKGMGCIPGTKDARRLMRSAFLISAISQYVKEYFGYWCPEIKGRISVVYMGSVIENGRPKVALPEGLEFSKPYILNVAILTKRKGIDILVMAFAEVLKQGYDVDLVLCGPDLSDGQLFPFIRQLGIEKRIHWIDQLPHSQAMSLMGNCLFFVSSSRSESFGRAIVEAMQAGKAVVATRVDGVPEIIREGVDGILVPPKDVEALSEAMIHLLKDVELRNRLAEEARKRSLNFSWDHAIKTYSKIYQSQFSENQQKQHPENKIALVIGGFSRDPGTQVTISNFSRGLNQNGQTRLAICVQRSLWKEPFQVNYPEWTLYHLGLPPMYGLKYLNAVIVCAQLLWLYLKERIRIWHYYLIVYEHLKGFVWFNKILNLKPIVTLS